MAGPAGTVFIVLGALLTIYTIVMTVRYSFNYGLLFCSLISLFLIVFGLFFPALSDVRWFMITVRILFSLLFIFIIFLAIFGSAANTDYNEDALVILGAGLKGDQPDSQLIKRLDRALVYLETNSEAAVIVSGGQGGDEDVSEAEAMKRYLVGKGIAENRIIKEEKSTSTYENFKFSKELLDGRFGEGYKVVVITNRFHVFRSSLIAHRLGIDCGFIGSDTPFFSVLMSYLRECAGIAHLIFFGT